MSLPNIKFSDASGRAHTLNSSERENVAFGQRMEYDDGRKFRFVKAGATLVVADLIQGKAVVSSDYTNLVMDSASAIGDTVLTFTGSSSTIKNYYAEGWMHVNKSAAGVGGYVYRVKSSLLFASSSGITVTLESFDPLRQIVAASDEIGVTPNPYSGAIQAPITTLTNRLVGVAVTPITSGNYGWVQSGGIAAVNCATSLIVGNIATAVLAAAGRLGVAIIDIDAIVGIVLSVPDASGEFGAIYLQLD